MSDTLVELLLSATEDNCKLKKKKKIKSKMQFMILLRRMKN